MNNVMQKGGALGNSVGRLGHGLGLQLTEWPSNTATDNTILKPGVILTRTRHGISTWKGNGP